MELEWRQFEKCPLCEAGQFRKRYDLGAVKVFQCLSCKLLFLNPYLSQKSMTDVYSSSERMRASNERLSRYYDRFEGSETERFYRRCLSTLQEIKKGGTLLDIGCGRGQFLSLAREFGWQVKGLEPAREHADYGKKHFRIDIVNAALEEAQFGSESFDVITMWDVIEHVPNPKETLNRVSRWLKPKGRLLLATPNHRSLLNFLAETTYVASGGLVKGAMNYFFVPEHVLYFIPATLHGLVRQCGLRPVKDLRAGTDIDRYKVGALVKITAKILLFLSEILRLQNRIILISAKSVIL